MSSCLKLASLKNWDVAFGWGLQTPMTEPQVQENQLEAFEDSGRPTPRISGSGGLGWAWEGTCVARCQVDTGLLVGTMLEIRCFGHPRTYMPFTQGDTFS